VALALSLLPSAEDIARADCVCRLFHVTPPPPAQPSACEWALRMRAAGRGPSPPPPLLLPEGETSWTQALLRAEVRAEVRARAAAREIAARAAPRGAPVL